MLGTIISALVIIVMLFKRYTIEAIITLLLVMHVLIGVVTQLSGIFSHGTVMFIHISIYAVLILYLLLSKHADTVLLPNKHNVKELVIGVGIFVIAFATLVQVHTNYTGFVSTHIGDQYVVNDYNMYPQFSDEWVITRVIQETSDSQKYPLSSVFFEKPKVNFLAGSHSLLAEVHVFLNANPLYFYTSLAVFAASLLLILAWRLLRVLNVSLFSSTFASLLMLYVVNGSNLPTLWYLLPWNIGFIFFILLLTFLSQKTYRYALMTAIMTVYLYPPMILFVLTACVGFCIKEQKTTLPFLKKYGYKIGYNMLLLCILIACLFFFDKTIEYVKTGFSFVIRPLNSLHGVPPQMFPWYIIPFVSLAGGIVGISLIFKKHQQIVYPVLYGILMWIVYVIGTPTILIDYHRIAAITSLLVAIVAGFGFDYLFSIVKDTHKKGDLLHNFFKNDTYHFATCIILILLFLVLSYTYTTRSNWLHIEKKVWNYDRGVYLTIPPKPPINRYLVQDDIRIFSVYQHKRFLAPHWKGLTIGVATDNIPVRTKPATFTIREAYLPTFLKLNCDEMVQYAAEHKIDLVYSSKIRCPYFKFIDKSVEGFHLYEFRGGIL